MAILSCETELALGTIRVKDRKRSQGPQRRDESGFG